MKSGIKEGWRERERSMDGDREKRWRGRLLERLP